MNIKHKIIIIGAGPIGCYLGQLLKKNNIESLIIEEHKELGRPIHCAGLVGRRVFEEIKIPISLDCILNTINGAIINFGNETIKIKREKVAYVIDRKKFDEFLGKDLNIIFETKFLGLEKNKNYYIIDTDKENFSAEIVIGADGANSLLRNILIRTNGIPYLRGVQFRMKFKPLYKDMVEVYIKRPYFYWLIPESEDIVRVGVISHNPYHNLLEFIKEKKMGKNILEKFAGIVPLKYFMPLEYNNLFLVGDSASQVKPLTYGGIYMGMRAAELLLDCLIKERFSSYTSMWFKKFGGEIKLMLGAREILNKLSEREIRKLFLFIKEKIKLIEEKADFENHSLLFWEILKQPLLSKEILSIFFKILKLNFTYNFK